MGEYEGKKPNKSSQHASHAPTPPIVGRSPAHDGPTATGEPAKPGARGSVFASGKLPWSGEGGHDRVAAPDAFDFGDIETSERRIESVFVFNQHPEPATVSAMLDAPPALQIVEWPSLLRPSHEGFDPATAFRIAYSPHKSAVDDGKLIVALRWSDGVTQTVRIKVRAAAHLRSEPTHAEQADAAVQAAQAKQVKATQARIVAAHEPKVQEALDRPGGIQPRIDLAYLKLEHAANHFFANQAAGVSAAGEKVSLYSRRQASASVDPPIALTILKAALDVGTGRVSSLVTAAFDGLAQKETTKFKQWQKGTTVDVSKGVMSGLSSVLGTVLSYGKDSIKKHLEWGPSESQGGDPSGESKVDFFTQQVKALNDSTEDRLGFLVGVKRALMPLNTPDLAKTAELILELLAVAFRQEAKRAVEQQAYETTRQWARFVSQASLGSVNPAEARKEGLATASDGGATAKMDKALRGSGTHGGMLDLEFSAELFSPTNPIKITSARLFGLSAASVKILRLDQQPLRSTGLPMRLRSSASSSPVSVTITRDEAGNVAFIDETGAVGMQTQWLSRRGRGHDDAAAYRAAKELTDRIGSQTVGQLGVELEIDDAS